MKTIQKIQAVANMVTFDRNKDKFASSVYWMCKREGIETVAILNSKYLICEGKSIEFRRRGNTYICKEF